VKQVLVIFKKELKDILRDKQSLVLITLVTVLTGPLMLMMLANMVSEFEIKAERRIVMVSGIHNSPTLINYLKRESAQIIQAPADYEQAIKQGQMSDPVLVIPPGFDKQWQAGDAVTLKVISNSANGRIQASLQRLKRWLGAYAETMGAWYRLQQNLPPRMQDFLMVEEVDQSADKAQSAKLFGMLPYLMVFAALYGVWGPAIETTVGEREKHTLESLLLTVKHAWNLTLGKWLAVYMTGAMLVILSVASFFQAQQFFSSENLKAMFNFTAHEAMVCLILFIPLAGLFATILMCLGTLAKNTRQAQTYATVVMLVAAILPVMVSFNDVQSGVLTHLFPVLAQHYYVSVLLTGESFSWLSIINLAFFTTCLSLLMIALSARLLGKVR
jgi:sodium transport system permease protein